MTGSISIPQSLQVTESWLAYSMPWPKLCSPKSGLPFLWWFFPIWHIRVDYVVLLPFFFLSLLASWYPDPKTLLSPVPPLFTWSCSGSYSLWTLLWLFSLISTINHLLHHSYKQTHSYFFLFSIHDQLLLSGLCFCTEILWWSHFCIQLLYCIPWYLRYVPFKVELLVKHECIFSNFDM